MSKLLFFLLVSWSCINAVATAEWFQTWDRPEYQEWAKPIDDGYLLHIIRNQPDNTILVFKAKLTTTKQGLPGFDVLEKVAVKDQTAALECIDQWNTASQKEL